MVAGRVRRQSESKSRVAIMSMLSEDAQSEYDPGIDMMATQSEYDPGQWLTPWMQSCIMRPMFSMALNICFLLALNICFLWR